ncbi:biotin transporter BioY [Collinsella phocaeensis]|uniref:biotin transporter BioY n=1 Tax=Collinsella phocaeensis TaxID=1871016 RepID=UPI000930041D|nr:biotin transporter BioY [Collinsella phocaeensis]
MDARQISRIGLVVALLAVSAWVTVPFGPVPFTLQTMALALVPAVLDRKGALAAVAAYLLLGGIGLPVFSGFGGGVGVLAGPTGGFLWGFLAGMAAACTLLRVLPETMPRPARVLVADVVMLLIAYACGTVQLMAVASLELIPALAMAVFPFIVPDAVKLAVGSRAGCVVARAEERRAGGAAA